jgi:zinc protease
MPRRGLFGGFVVFLFAVVCAPTQGSALSYTRHVLPNRLVVLVSEQHAVPMVVVQALVEAGARRDPAGQEGLAALTADLLTEGAGKRSATEIGRELDFLGARIDTSAETDYAVASLVTLSRHFERAFGVFADVLTRPTFPPAELQRRREAALAAIRSEQDNPGALAQRKFLELVFGDTPYGHPPIGSESSVSRLTRREVESFFQRYYRPNGTILAVTGDVETNTLLGFLEGALRHWKPRTVDEFSYPSIPQAPERLSVIQKPLTQANLIAGHIGVARDNPDFYALTVMNFILGGGGFTSRLVESVRVEGGLAYSVGSFFTANKFPGTFQVSLQTKTPSLLDALKRVCRELERIRNEPVSEDELQGAKLYLTGSFPLRLDSNSKVAAFLAQVEFFGLGEKFIDEYLQKIQAVTREDVQRVAQRYVHPEDLRLVVVGDVDRAALPADRPCAGRGDQ